MINKARGFYRTKLDYISSSLSDYPVRRVQFYGKKKENSQARRVRKEAQKIVHSLDAATPSRQQSRPLSHEFTLSSADISVIWIRCQTIFLTSND